MEKFSMDIHGVGDLNLMITALESVISTCVELDMESEARGCHIGTEARRNLRRNIRTSAEMLLRVWDLWETAHMKDQCEHQTCPVNGMGYTSIHELVRMTTDNVRDVIANADAMDAEAGDEIAPEPPRPQDDVVETLRRILRNVSPN